LREEQGSSSGIDIVLEGCLTYAIEESDSSGIRMIREQLGLLDSVRSVPDRTVSRRITSTEPHERVIATGPETAIGLICPLTGRFAMLGEAFLKGASVALREAERHGTGGVSLIVGDTKGNPLEALKVTERMI
ncbi:MAG TPA: hypothetical protein VLA34_11390, partial [Candidatus Krumholzibacterium sp.]|nr:hypothetical protein [Candidatus Krumholzibacterium sp.]